MGFYTELKFKAKLKKDTPDDVINLLNRVINERDLGHDKVFFKSEDVFKPDLDHSFFKCPRWYMLFLSTNWDPDMQGGKFYEKDGRWVLDLYSEFKNYDSEISKFLEWISPYIVGRKKKQCVGYSKGESWDYRENLYVTR